MGPDSGVLLSEFIEIVVPHLKKKKRIEYQTERVLGGPHLKLCFLLKKSYAINFQ